ncbi:N-6 DNA methylase [Dactylosporangium siamense]|uniref:site-specific DNA-methyltransferase (adenine-specific) n=1 Tax=Dactylosporangium siamense TaxID=685454 RepID=A0A919PZB6_9ACTN|nr:N-6 DNA methylase [Dactylosporangium siamense]GIG53197.1 hypothetical protein Dsi01nite_112380 [Dactylosporangium siamense]
MTPTNGRRPEVDQPQLALFELATHPVPAAPRRRRPSSAPADPTEHTRRVAAAVDAAWRREHGSGTELHIPTSVVAALALIAQADPDGPDLADQVTALDPNALGRLLHHIWRSFMLTRGDLAVRVAPLVAWLHQGPSDTQLTGAHAVARAALDAGQLHLTGHPDRRHATDLFGELLQLMRGPKVAASRGAYYTPPGAADALTHIVGVADAAPGASIADPAAGTGILLLSAARRLREHGKDPADFRWYGNDIDELAAACLAVNDHLWGLGTSVFIAATDGLNPDWHRQAVADRATGSDIARAARAVEAVNALTRRAA